MYGYGFRMGLSCCHTTRLLIEAAREGKGRERNGHLSLRTKTERAPSDNFEVHALSIRAATRANISPCTA